MQILLIISQQEDTTFVSATILTSATIQKMSSESSPTTTNDVVVQYIIIRRDLMSPPYSYAIGSIVSQGCHASVSIISECILSRDETTLQYVDPNSPVQMHKIVLECPSEKQLLSVRDSLEENQIRYKMWVEQPENVPTALAIKPYPRSLVAKFVKKLKLFK